MQTEDEKAVGNSSEKQGKSKSDKLPEEHRCGVLCANSPLGSQWSKLKKGRSKSNSSSGSNTPPEPLKPSVPNTDDRAESKSPENKQNFFRRAWSRWSGGSNKSSKENSPEESAPPVKNESQLLKPEAPIR